MNEKKLKITAKQLAEYMTGSLTVRDHIIDDLLDDEFDTNKLWYVEFKSGFKHYLTTQDFYASFEDLRHSLKTRDAHSDQAERKIIKELEAIDMLAATQIFQSLPETEFSNLEKKFGSLELPEVRITSGATNLLQKDISDQKQLGLIAPFLKASKPLTSDSARIFCCILHWTAEDNFKDLGKISPKLCVAVDVFANKTYYAPPSFKNLRKEIILTAREIQERVSSRYQTRREYEIGQAV